jgi:hypothetical protein
MAPLFEVCKSKRRLGASTQIAFQKKIYANDSTSKKTKKRERPFAWQLDDSAVHSILGPVPELVGPRAYKDASEDSLRRVQRPNAKYHASILILLVYPYPC